MLSKKHEYVMRGQALKAEELERTQRKEVNWRRRQQHKQGRNIKVRPVSRQLLKRFTGRSRNKTIRKTVMTNKLKAPNVNK